MQKAGAQRIAAELGIALVAPDTSPRGEGIPDDPGYDLGMGAGFTSTPPDPGGITTRWRDYVTRELPELIETHFPVSTRRAISGHSMGPRRPHRCPCASPAATDLCRPSAPSATRAAAPGARRHSAPTSATTPAVAGVGCLPAAAPPRQPAPADPGGRGAGRPFLAEQLGIDTLAEVAATREWPSRSTATPVTITATTSWRASSEAHLRFHASHLGEPAWD